MKHKNLLIGVCLVLILALAPIINVEARKSKLLYLHHHEVVPSGTGDPNMFGEATIDVNAGHAQICYWMRVFIYAGFDEWPPTSAGIYNAPAGQNGPLVVDLNPDWGPLGEPTVSGCVNIDKDLAHDIQRRPSQYYLLLTDQSYPAGAARAQLVQ